MKKLQWKSPKGIAIIASAVAVVVAIAVVLTVFLLQDSGIKIIKVPATEEYVYINPDETTAKTDPGITIDGVLDEEVYAGKNWLYLSNDDGGNEVNIALTSHFGTEGMYFVFDVTETAPIYVNLDRSPTLNSCIELYLAPPYVTRLTDNSILEIDLLPTGDLAFRQSNGKYGYINVTTSNDIMACLGATTKGGEVNTTDCYGYALELFIPWSYLEWLGMDVAAIKDSYLFVNPAHITSHNLTGTNNDLDRYWYYYVQQVGTDFTAVTQYFRFNGDGAMGTVEIELEEGEHYRFEGHNVALPNLKVPITIIPEEGYALTSILLDGQEQMSDVSFNEDGSVTLLVRCTGDGQKISAVAEPVTEGKKTLRGKVFLNGVEDVFVSYEGPLGEKPITVDANGNFELKDLEPGYYILKLEKQGAAPVTRGIYLNQDIYTELTLKIPVFTTTYGNSWILDDENKGILHKINGRGEIISNDSYNDFTFESYVKYDTELAKQGEGDYYLQQRSGMRVLFSNGKYWHVDLMLENGKYVVQYAKHTGDNSIFNWKNVHTLTKEQIEKYTSADGIKLTIKRVGNQAAVCLDDKVLLVEELPAEYKDYTAKLGLEAWIANSRMMTVPYSITGKTVLPEAPKLYFYTANTWDVSKQEQGVIYKTGVSGDTTWLDSAIIGNDITTIAKDLTPEANDYSMVYIFKFSNGEQFRLRLNHTDNDGKYRIQSFSGSTLFDPWKNHYTFNDAQTQKVKGAGIAFRVWISGTTAYVYLDGQQVCTYDLSTVIATGLPSGIEKATANVSLRIDGVIGKTVEVPFELKQTDGTVTPEEPTEPEEPEKPVDPAKKVNLTIGKFANGTVKPNRTAYAVGDTVTLNIIPKNGYTQKLYINGEPLLLDWKTNSYKFVATEKNYTITGSFVKSLDTKPSDPNRWDAGNQAHGVLNAYYPYNNDAWYMDIMGEYSSIAINAKNYWPIAESYEGIEKGGGFRVVLRMALDNGKNYAFSIWIDTNKVYAYNHFGGGGSATGWGGAWCLPGDKNAEATAALNGNGAEFKLERIDGNHIQISLGGTVLETYTIPDVTEANKVVSVGIQHYGNPGEYVQMPFTVTLPSGQPPVVEPPVDNPPVDNPIKIKIPTLSNGTIKTEKSAYTIGDTVTLIIEPKTGYAQKLYLDGEAIMLDWQSNTYSFVAEKENYEITGSFVKALDVAPKDPGRWDDGNQAHGVLNAYYPYNNDAWWVDVNGEYSSITIQCKNYRSMADSMDGNGNVGYSQVLRITLDNGQFYAFRIINDKGTYAYDRYGAGSANGWGNWKRLDDATVAALGGEGVEFKLERTGDNVLTISLNGVVMETYVMAGVTAANKVVSVGTHHYGNSGSLVEIPFVVE